MRRYRLAGLIALAVVLTAGGSFVAGRATAGSDITVTAAANGVHQCREDKPYHVRYVVKGIEHGICVSFGSDCAIDARVGDSLPKACGG